MTETPLIVISLRIRHPNIDPDVITKKMGLTPDTTHCFNKNKTTPKGTKLDGVYKESFWSKKFDNNENYDLSKLIEFLNNTISDKATFLKQITETGGTIEYFIGCFIRTHIGEILEWKLLSQCADLNINLAFDIYNDLEK